jgi:hypothetical protein
MHVDKIDATKGKQSFFDKVLSFDLSILFFWNIYRRSSHHKPSKEAPKSESKMDTKNHEKAIFNLTTGQFLFSKYITIKGLYILKNMCWVFDQKAWFYKKIFFKQRHLWFHFNKLDLNRHDLWNVRVDSRRKIVRQNIDWVCEILDRNDINSSQHSLKSWAT